MNRAGGLMVPSELKPAYFLGLSGTAEAGPDPKKFVSWLQKGHLCAQKPGIH